MKYSVLINDQPVVVEITEEGDSVEVRVNGRKISTSVVSDERHQRFLMLLNARAFDTEVYQRNGTTSVLLAGREFECVVEDERLASIRKIADLGSGHHVSEVRAPMPGLVVKMLRGIGDRVKRGESLVVVEAMKMENDIKSPSEGTIKEIHVEPGKAVDKGQVLITLEK